MREIANNMGITSRQVQTALSNDDVTPQSSKGRGPALSEEQVDKLEAFVCSSSATRLMGYLEIANVHFKEWGVSEKVIRDALKKRGYSRCKVRKISRITESTEKKKKECKAHHEWTTEDWDFILRSDDIRGSNDQYTNIWITRKVSLITDR